MRRRSRSQPPPPGSAAGELAALEREAAAAAEASGDERAVDLHRQVTSWQAMAAAAGGDAEITGLFAIFASEGRERLREWWANPGAD
jgi:hypothetical protein